jgi:hypothetical protein
MTAGSEMINLQHIVIEFDKIARLEPPPLQDFVSSFSTLATITVARRNHPHTFCANKGSAPIHALLRLEDCGSSQCTAKRDVHDAAG